MFVLAYTAMYMRRDSSNSKLKSDSKAGSKTGQRSKVIIWAGGRWYPVQQRQYLTCVYAFVYVTVCIRVCVRARACACSDVFQTQTTQARIHVYVASGHAHSCVWVASIVSKWAMKANGVHCDQCRVMQGLDPLNTRQVYDWEKACSCYGSRQTLASPSESVLCLMRIVHTAFLPHTLSDGDVKVCLLYDGAWQWVAALRQFTVGSVRPTVVSCSVCRLLWSLVVSVAYYHWMLLFVSDAARFWL